jgi:hypothetical protein
VDRDERIPLRSRRSRRRAKKATAGKRVVSKLERRRCFIRIQQRLAAGSINAIAPRRPEAHDCWRRGAEVTAVCLARR